MTDRRDWWLIGAIVLIAFVLYGNLGSGPDCPKGQHYVTIERGVGGIVFEGCVDN